MQAGLWEALQQAGDENVALMLEDDSSDDSDSILCAAAPVAVSTGGGRVPSLPRCDDTLVPHIDAKPSVGTVLMARFDQLSGHRSKAEPEEELLLLHTLHCKLDAVAGRLGSIIKLHSYSIPYYACVLLEDRCGAHADMALKVAIDMDDVARKVRWGMDSDGSCDLLCVYTGSMH